LDSYIDYSGFIKTKTLLQSFGRHYIIIFGLWFLYTVHVYESDYMSFIAHTHKYW